MDDSERGTSVVAARLAVVAAGVLGVGAVTLYNRLSGPGERLVLLIAVIAVGAAVWRSPRMAVAVGSRLSAGIGAGAVYVGAQLLGPVLVVSALERGQRGPSVWVVVVLIYLPVLVALVALAVARRVAGVVGLAVLLPTLALMLLVVGEVSQLTITLTMLGIALVGLAVALRAPDESSRDRYRFGATLGAVAAAGVVGSGVLPFSAITDPDSALRVFKGAALDNGPRVAAVVVGLLIAVVLAVLAVLRRDVMSGVVAAAPLLVPQVELLSGRGSDETLVVVAVFPVVVAVVALAGALLPAARAVADRVAGWLRPGGATSRPALVAVAVAALLSFTTSALPVLRWEPRLGTAVAVAVCALAVVTALRLPGMPGVLVATLALLGLSWSGSVYWLVVGINIELQWLTVLGAVLGLVVAVVVTWLLVRAHRHPAVVVAAAYLLVGRVAQVLWEAVHPSYNDLFGGLEAQEADAVTMFLPLIVLGVVGVVVVARGRTPFAVASGQGMAVLAVGAVGVALLSVLAGFATRFNSARAELEANLSPFTPTKVQLASNSPDDPGVVTLVVVLCVLALAIAAATTAAKRPSAALAAAVVFTVVWGSHMATAATLSTGGGSGFSTLMYVALILGGAVGILAIVMVRRAPDEVPPWIAVKVNESYGSAHFRASAPRPVRDAPLPDEDSAEPEEPEEPTTGEPPTRPE
ncbi:hypothetical protein V5P93_001787 [Actinokineospora auranticolor]|uniref:Uncharacterized protein n=1 Tax=Actinokineospora auranticolor TaxID=155976 RepID=A0A2S6GGS3_9PSEU|nr:hypothetical protein [Actinokineospora auranticolor]PPK64391.1 hypothetical protein CLV40_120114 [Actinokineospora auranticolor]